jgi:hypothetical protein
VKLSGPVALERHARTLRRAKVVLGVVLLPLYAGCPFLWAGIVGGLWWAQSAARRAQRRLRGARDGSVEVTADSLVIDLGGRRTTVPRASVANGWIEPAAGGFAATIELSSGAMIFVKQDTFEEAASLVDALGLGARGRVLRVALGTEAASAGQGMVMHLVAPWLVGALCFSFLLVPSVLAIASFSLWSLLGLVLLAIPLGLMWRFAQYVTPARCDIGSDGVMTRHLGTRRFVRLADIRGVVRERTGVRLVRYESELLSTLADPVLPTAVPGDSGVARRDAIAWRIEAEMARRAGDDGTDRYATLARANRPVKQWRAETIEQARQAGSGYRTVDFETEELVRVVENARAPLDRRLGAAFVLGGRSIAGGELARVRVAADAVADPQVRAALAHAVERDAPDEEFDAAIQADAPRLTSARREGR